MIERARCSLTTLYHSVAPIARSILPKKSRESRGMSRDCIKDRLTALKSQVIICLRRHSWAKIADSRSFAPTATNPWAFPLLKSPHPCRFLRFPADRQRARAHILWGFISGEKQTDPDGLTVSESISAKWATLDPTERLSVAQTAPTAPAC